MTTPHLKALTATLFCSMLAAQSFVVDVNNGPGTNFTSLAAAVTAVPDGAWLRVRAGAYQPFLLNQKGLTILADPGVSILGTARIENTAITQTTILAGLGMTTRSTGQIALLEVRNCAGLVMLEQITTPLVLLPYQPTGSPFGSTTYGLGAWNCDQLFLRSSTLTNAITYQSTAVFESCVLHAMPETSVAGIPVSATNGLYGADGSWVLTGNTQVFGGGNSTSFPAPAIFGYWVDIRILDGSVLSGPAGTGGSWAIVNAGGGLRIDPRVVVLASLGTPIFGSFVIGPMPEVTSSSASPGGTLQATVATAVGDTVVLCVSLPGPPTTFPGLQQSVWLAASSIRTQAFGVQQTGAPVSGACAVPNLPALLGTAVAWQAVAWNVTAGWSLTNPSLGLVR